MKDEFYGPNFINLNPYFSSIQESQDLKIWGIHVT